MNLTNRIDFYMAEQIANNTICGAVVLIAKDGVVYHEQAYGFAQKYKLDTRLAAENSTYLEIMSQCKSLLTPPALLATDYLFDLASLTKVLATTMGVMLLVDQEKIRLDDQVRKYLPEFDKPDKALITIRHLLSHSSGLAPWKSLYYYVSNADEAVKFISEQPLAYEVDVRRAYSDLGLIILRHIIECVSGQVFEEFLQKNLYDKLNLHDTLFNPLGKKEKIAATSHGNPFEYKMIAEHEFGYEGNENVSDFSGWRQHTLHGEVNDGNAHHVFSGVSGHAGLFATAADVNILLQLLLDDGRYQELQIIRRDTVKEFLTKNKYGHGLGWAMSGGNAVADLPLGDLSGDEFFAGAFGHTGFTGTFVLGIPENRVSIVVLTNRQNLGVNAEGKYNDLNAVYQSVVNFVKSDLQTLANSGLDASNLQFG